MLMKVYYILACKATSKLKKKLSN